jgi:two-component system CheB/CheR fusion protein
VRDLCVFARHDLLSDPPFARLDVLSCQNLLMYLKAEIQQKLIQIFHYALNPQGVLLLGSSETIGTASDLFAPLGERKQQVYVKKSGSARPLFAGPVSLAGKKRRDLTEEEHRMQREERGQEGDLQRKADHLLLARYAPASVVVDAQMEIHSVRGHTSPYLEPAPGRASLNLFRMARAGLDLELRAALSKAKKSARPVKKTGIQIRDHGHTREVAVEIVPLEAQGTEPSFLILFEEGVTEAPSEPSAPWSQEGAPTERAKRGTKDRRIQHLEQGLAARSEEMRILIEEQEAANEELQSANEEILSSNEELQSLNEELETSREEIQASNEELLVVNAELRQRNAQAQEAREFADAIVETVREPLLVLDADLRVQRANRAFYHYFQVTPVDTERRRIFELGEGQWNIRALRTLLEELLPTNHAFADYEVEHTFSGIGHRILLLNAQRIDSVPLILLAMEDITERKRVEGEKQRMLSQREEFMAIASHELKTPVTSLKGYAQLLQARFTTAGDERSATALARMDAQLDKLIHLIGELLDETSIEAGKLPWRSERFDLETLVRDVAAEVSQTSERHQIRIEGAIRTPVSGDPERIGQVLINLLTNAIKYSPQADTILVTLVAGAESATVGVQDFGIGLAPEKQSLVFERFFRVSDPEHATFPGLGLGLFISAQIVTRHGGRMWVDSQLGAGSTFSFTIPYAPPPAPDSQP